MSTQDGMKHSEMHKKVKVGKFFLVAKKKLGWKKFWVKTNLVLSFWVETSFWSLASCEKDCDVHMYGKLKSSISNFCFAVSKILTSKKSFWLGKFTMINDYLHVTKSPVTEQSRNISQTFFHMKHNFLENSKFLQDTHRLQKKVRYLSCKDLDLFCVCHVFTIFEHDHWTCTMHDNFCCERSVKLISTKWSVSEKKMRLFFWNFQTRNSP